MGRTLSEQLIARMANENPVAVQAAIAAETAALIAETEQSFTKRIDCSVSITLTRVYDQAGQPVPNCFVASCELPNGQTVSAEAGKRPTALAELQAQIQRRGYEPHADSYTDLTQHETPAEESEEPPSEILDFGPTEEPEDTDTEPGEHESPAFGLVARVPVLDKYGWLTPLSDPAAWLETYISAWKLTTGFGPYVFSDLRNESSNIRASISACMRSGIAGEECGIAAKAVGPWDLGTNGEKEMCWVRVLPKTPDPTTRPFRSGMGPAREAHLTTLSGLAAFPEKAEAARLQRERKQARQYIGTKRTGVPAHDRLDAIKAAAHSAGQAAKTAAFENGQAEFAEIHYRWIYCAAMRMNGEVHAEYERQLAEVGITSEMIIDRLEAMKAA